MNFKSISLYIVGAALLLFGQRDLWTKLKEERNKEKQDLKLAKQAQEEAQREFEVQKLKFDSTTRNWVNPTPYFQLVNASYINFDVLRKKSLGQTRIESGNEENASDSN